MKIFLFILALAIPSLSFAGFMNGDRLTDLSNSSDRAESRIASPLEYQESAYLLGFVTGVSDSVEDSLVCIKGQVPANELVRIVKKYVFDHPNDLSMSASVLVVLALSKPFPCK
jgi:hypothetical protein